MADPKDKPEKQKSLPFPPTPSASIAGRTMQEFGLQTAGDAAPASGRCAEHSDRSDRRCGSRPSGDVRRRGANPDDGPNRNFLQQVSYDSHVFANPGVTFDRPQSSPRR